MESWVPYVSLAMGVLAFMILQVGRQYLLEGRVPKKYARWQDAVRTEVYRYVDAQMYLAEREQRLAELLREVPEGYSRVVWAGVETAQALPPAVLAKAEQLGLYQPGTFLSHGYARSVASDTFEPPGPASEARYIGTHAILPGRTNGSPS